MALVCNILTQQELHSGVCSIELPSSLPLLRRACNVASPGTTRLVTKSFLRASQRESFRSHLPVSDAAVPEEVARKGSRHPAPWPSAPDTMMLERGTQNGAQKAAYPASRTKTQREFVSEQAFRKKSKQTPLLSEDVSYNEEIDEDPDKAHLTQTRFDEFNISPLSIKALHNVLKYETMTVVQEATFPIILQGRDVMAKARTGTGKTIAFLLPAIELILKESGEKYRDRVFALIVCPTRELAQQVAKEANQLLHFYRNLSSQAVYGGTNIHGEQIKLHQNSFQILVGTPGRLVDHIQNTPRFRIFLSSVKLFVLDEADRMLDMGFKQSLEQIKEALPSERQNLLFSATIPKEVHNIAKSVLKAGYEFIDTVGDDSQDTHAKVKQQCVVVPLKQQISVLFSILQQHIQEDPNYKVLVFCVTARVTGFMFNLFEHLGFSCREIHSRKSQGHRNRVSEEFRNSKGGLILFTSDVSARGVDYPDVTCVVQVGAPPDADQYVHRLGRTGRAGKGGEGLLMLAPWEAFFLNKLQKFPITKVPTPSNVPQDTKMSAAAAQVDLGSRTMAYQSWIGYYNSFKGLNFDKPVLIEYANEFSAAIGFKNPPVLPKLTVRKMGLLGVRGLNVK